MCIRDRPVCMWCIYVRVWVLHADLIRVSIQRQEIEGEKTKDKNQVPPLISDLPRPPKLRPKDRYLLRTTSIPPSSEDRKTLNHDHPHATLSARLTPQDRPNMSHSLVTTTYFYWSHSHTRPKTKQVISHLGMWVTVLLLYRPPLWPTSHMHQQGISILAIWLAHIPTLGRTAPLSRTEKTA